MAEDVLGRTHLMEVLLDIQSDRSLEPLADSFGPGVCVRYSKLVNGVYETRAVASDFSEFPDSTILALCRAVRALPESARMLWDSASSRTFDIGIEAAVRSTFWFALKPETLEASAAIKARIVVTVYGPDNKNKDSKVDAIRRVRHADAESS